MTVTLSLSAWLLPIGATVIALLLAIFFRADSYAHDQYGFGAALDGLFRIGFGAFMTLGIWLVFFGVMWWRA